MHLSEVNEALSHKINGGSEFQWSCWDNGRYLDYESEYAHASVVFNSETQEVYCAEINDKANIHKPYRWMNPSYKDLYFNEANQRKVDPNTAWDDKNWYDLEVSEDWFEKATAIFNGEEFDERVQVPLEIDNNLFMQLAMQAHERDITINKMVEEILRTMVEKHKIDQAMYGYEQDLG